MPSNPFFYFLIIFVILLWITKFVTDDHLNIIKFVCDIVNKLFLSISLIGLFSLIAFVPSNAFAIPVLVDFEDSTFAGNITCNSVDFSIPFECAPSNHDYIKSKGIDITGTPAGFLSLTRIVGSIGDTGKIIQYASPSFVETHTGISDNEILTIHFLASPVKSTQITFTTSPIPSSTGTSEVRLTAFDASNNILGITTQSFTGVTGGVLTPATVDVSTSSYQIDHVEIEPLQHVPKGVYIAGLVYDTQNPPDIILPIVIVPSDFTEISPDNIGKVITFSVTATDNIGVTVGPTCIPPSGFFFTIGNTQVNCTAEDAAGNIGIASFSVEVLSPSQGVERLINMTNNLPISNGITNSLTATLDPFDPNNIPAACGKLDAFLSKVDTKESNGQLTALQASQLRQFANDLKLAIGC